MGTWGSGSMKEFYDSNHEFAVPVWRCGQCILVATRYEQLKPGSLAEVQICKQCSRDGPASHGENAAAIVRCARTTSMQHLQHGMSWPIGIQTKPSSANPMRADSITGQVQRSPNRNLFARECMALSVCKSNPYKLGMDAPPKEFNCGHPIEGAVVSHTS